MKFNKLEDIVGSNNEKKTIFEIIKDTIIEALRSRPKAKASVIQSYYDKQRKGK